jgi:predicted house-cleaning noncanonical NTP pyrophosphatase (MazG superfamily)
MTDNNKTIRENIQETISVWQKEHNIHFVAGVHHHDKPEEWIPLVDQLLALCESIRAEALKEVEEELRKAEKIFDKSGYSTDFLEAIGLMKHLVAKLSKGGKI